jgi:hypothetical protein
VYHSNRSADQAEQTGECVSEVVYSALIFVSSLARVLHRRPSAGPRLPARPRRVRQQRRGPILKPTVGTADIVKFGALPVRYPSEEIAKLIARTDSDGTVRLSSRAALQPTWREIFAPGAGVVIADGPFLGFDAIYA